MKSTILDTNFQYNGQEAQKIYAYLQQAVETESSDQVLMLFRCLFIEGRKCEDQEVNSAIESLIKSKWAEKNFKFILNHCCYIIINHWHREYHLQPSILELIEMFKGVHAPKYATFTPQDIMRSLAEKFTNTEQYTKLKSLAKILSKSQDNETYIGDLIVRYPYLYYCCLLSEDSGYADEQTIRRIQRRKKRRFEQHLSQYVSYQLRRSRKSQRLQLPEETQPVIKECKNPTLLKDRDLGKYLKYFVGKVEGNCTHQDLAKNFLTLTSQTSSYKLFKQDLYEYIISAVGKNYRHNKFNEQLAEKLENILPECNSQQLNESLMVRTCNQLFRFLIVGDPPKYEHYVFINLVANLGLRKTIGLLVKLVLLSSQIQPALEKRFAILFTHYESCRLSEVAWLVKSLETLNIAFCVNFGKTDFSFLKKML